MRRPAPAIGTTQAGGVGVVGGGCGGQRLRRSPSQGAAQPLRRRQRTRSQDRTVTSRAPRGDGENSFRTCAKRNSGGGRGGQRLRRSLPHHQGAAQPLRRKKRLAAQPSRISSFRTCAKRNSGGGRGGQRLRRSLPHHEGAAQPLRRKKRLAAQPSRISSFRTCAKRISNRALRPTGTGSLRRHRRDGARSGGGGPCTGRCRCCRRTR